MKKSLIALVQQRAAQSCEYCRLPQAHSAIPFEIDHIRAKKHSGPTNDENLALACFFCNSASARAPHNSPPANDLSTKLHGSLHASIRHENCE
jgi:5-methylcytosine-specific restriction endonuclease McrA